LDLETFDFGNFWFLLQPDSGNICTLNNNSQTHVYSRHHFKSPPNEQKHGIEAIVPRDSSDRWRI